VQPQLLVARLTAGGILDLSFGDDGKAAVPLGGATVLRAASVAVDVADRIVVGGMAGDAMGVMRLTPDARFDASFGGELLGLVTRQFEPGSLDEVADVAIDGRGHVLAAGWTRPASTTTTYAGAFLPLLPGNVSVTASGPSLDAGGDLTVGQGVQFERTGSFEGPGSPAWTATVDYGDGTGPQPLALGPDNSFTLRHTYETAGAYSVNVTMDGGPGGVASDTFVVTARGPALGFTGGDDVLHLRLSADGKFVEFFENVPLTATAGPTFTLPVNQATSIAVPASAGHDEVFVHSGAFSLVSLWGGSHVLPNRRER
jgi:hypothetical protein